MLNLHPYLLNNMISSSRLHHRFDPLPIIIGLILFVLGLIFFLLCCPCVAAQVAFESGEKNVLPVLFPGVSPHPLANGVPVMQGRPPLPAPAPAGIRPSPTGRPNPSDEAAIKKAHVNVSIMKGEVHLKNLNSKMGAGEILNINTGNRSACEFKLGSGLGRVWQDSDVTVFAASNLIMLNRGELVFRARNGSGMEYTIICGDLLCRVDATTVHVTRSERDVKFKVLEGTVTVFNRQTGEILKVSP